MRINTNNRKTNSSDLSLLKVKHIANKCKEITNLFADVCNDIIASFADSCKFSVPQTSLGITFVPLK